MTPWQTFTLCLIFWNLVTLTVTLLDKRAAEKRRRRTPERRFLFFAATLGGGGVLTAFYAVRHKTRHAGLLAGVWTLTILSYALLFAAIWFRYN